MMTKNKGIEMDAINQAKSIVARCLHIPVESIDDQAAISSVAELDSVSFEQIALEVEKHIGHTVDPIKLLAMRSIKDLAALLEDKP